jgi:hypothetical protein
MRRNMAMASLQCDQGEYDRALPLFEECLAKSKSILDYALVFFRCIETIWNFGKLIRNKSNVKEMNQWTSCDEHDRFTNTRKE